MHYAMAVIALASSTSVAQPPVWRLAATSRVSTPSDYYAATFVDTASIRRTGDQVAYRSLSVWGAGISSGDNARREMAANCRDHGYRALHTSFYKGSAAVENGAAEPAGQAAPESARYVEIDAVCGTGRWLTRQIRDPYAWSGSAFQTLRRGGYWPLELDQR